MIAVNKNNEMYQMIKLAVAEAIREESVHLFLNSQPYVSDKEMEEIEKISPPDYFNIDEYLDVSEWV